ncbi:hypothetical protein [Emticicia sp. BO119]|uniref:hypothetical protein n=1 Tax=Emticicia sp. BO119 TaxID=2757768 RepID=UPI0015F0EAFE|nr:hypothetical protein [Emticicia sp. BO119]MBA4852697.1 hypothetical protein [Emticicia sp. BO119]
MRALLCLLFCAFLLEGVAQPDRNEYIGNKFSFFTVMNMGNGAGKYQTLLKERNRLGTQFGISGGLLLNPFFGKKSFPIMIGGEVGTINYWERPITSYPGDFSITTFSNWLNVLVRYRPILWSSRFNPYIDAFYGVKYINSSLWENLGEDGARDLQKWTTTTPNYGVGIGVGLKLFRSEKNLYFDVGIYYKQADATKILKPNSVLIDNSFGITSTEIVTNTNLWVVKLGLTWFNTKFE